MPKWVHPDALIDGLNVVVAAGNEMWLTGSYSVGQDYATVSGNRLCPTVPMVVGNGNDYLVALVGNDQQVTVAAKTGTANVDNPAPSLHVVLADGVRVLAVTKAADQPISNGNPINFPAWNMNAPQPV